MLVEPNFTFFFLFHAVNQTWGTNCREKGWGPEMEGDKHPVAHPLCDKEASRIWDYLTNWWFTHQPPWQGPLQSSISYVRTSLWPYLCLEFFLSVQISAAFVKQPPSTPPWVDHTSGLLHRPSHPFNRDWHLCYVHNESLSLDLGKEPSDHSCHLHLYSPLPLSNSWNFSHCGQSLKLCCCFKGNWIRWGDPTLQVVFFNHFLLVYETPKTNQLSNP